MKVHEATGPRRPIGGDTVLVTLASGDMFTARFVDERDGRTVLKVDVATPLKFPAVFKRMCGDGLARIPLHEASVVLAEVRDYGPKAVTNETMRARALDRIDEATTLLQNPWATKADVMRAKALLNEAANAAHWSVVSLRDAIQSMSDGRSF